MTEYTSWKNLQTVLAVMEREWLGRWQHQTVKSPTITGNAAGLLFVLIWVKLRPAALKEAPHGVSSYPHLRRVLVEQLTVVEDEMSVGRKLLTAAVPEETGDKCLNGTREEHSVLCVWKMSEEPPLQHKSNPSSGAYVFLLEMFKYRTISQLREQQTHEKTHQGKCWRKKMFLNLPKSI